MTYPVVTFGTLTELSLMISCRSNTASLGAFKCTPLPSIRSRKSESNPNGPVETGLGVGTVFLSNQIDIFLNYKELL
jgi:hypothetical protein